MQQAIVADAAAGMDEASCPWSLVSWHLGLLTPFFSQTTPIPNAPIARPTATPSNNAPHSTHSAT